MIITRKQTARETVKYCHKVGGRLVNIDSDETLQTVIELGNIQREISLNDPNLTVEDYNDFWQNVKQGPSGQYVFANTDKSLPLSLNNKSVANKVHPLVNNCAHYIKDTNEFKRASCTDTKFKKYGICQSEVNRNDILVLESHLATYEEEIKELNATRLLLQQQIDQLEEDHVSDNKPIIANIFSKFQGKLISSIATFTENSLNSRGLNVLINANKALLTRLRTLSNSLETQNVNPLIPLLQLKDEDTVGKEWLTKLQKEQVIHSRFTRTENKRIQIKVTTGTNTTRMRVIELQPLVINGQLPVLTSSALLTAQHCYQNTCLKNPCVIKKPIKSGCCSKHILDRHTNCPKTKRYLTKIKEDEFLLVTAQPMTVYSENCAYLKATIQGTYVINVKPNGKGCNLFLDDFRVASKRFNFR